MSTITIQDLIQVMLKDSARMRKDNSSLWEYRISSAYLLADSIDSSRQVRAGEAIREGRAVVEYNGFVYTAETPLPTSELQERINGVWRPATLEGCPHFWVPRSYSLPSEVQTTSSDPVEPSARSLTLARMIEAMESAFRNTCIDQPIVDIAALQLSRASLMEMQRMQSSNLSESDIAAFNRGPGISPHADGFSSDAAQAGKIATDSDRETVDTDDLDDLFAQIDEVICDASK